MSWWAMEAVDGAFEATAEVDALRWLSTEEAGRVLTRQTDRDLLVRFVSSMDRRPDRALADRAG